MMNTKTEEESQWDPQVVDYIEKMEHPQILMSEIDFKKGDGDDISHKVSKRGWRSDAEKKLFKYINMILQYPACFRDGLRVFSVNTKRIYSHAIARYVSHMAKKGFTKDSFVINGFFIVQCMEEYIEDESEKKGMDLLTGGGSMYSLVNALNILLNCLGIYHTRQITDLEERKEALLKSYTKIPHVVEMTQYFKDRRKAINVLRRKDFLDNTRPDTCHERITLDQMKKMMINMYELTGVRDNRGDWCKTNIYNGINATLELLLGKSCLLKGQNKVKLELSDSLYHDENTKNGIVPVLGFSLNLSETHDETPRLIGACRHKHVELCLVSAFAMSLWYRFDFGDKYAPNASNCNAEFFLSKQNWYPLKVLFSADQSFQNNDPISWNHEAKLIILALASIDHAYSKETHTIGARNSDAFRILESQIERTSFWSNEVIDETYLCYPFGFMHCAGGFLEDEKYHLPRQIEPPEELQKEIFPWLEEVTSAIHNRTDHQGLARPQRDQTVVRFVKILKDFRSVILQDLAIMLEKAPNSIFSRHEITKHPLFIKFKADVHKRISPSPILDFTSDQKDVARALAPVFVNKVERLRVGMEKSFLQVHEEHSTQNTQLCHLQTLIQDMSRKLRERDDANREFTKATIEEALQVYSEKYFARSVNDLRDEMRESFARLEEVYKAQRVTTVMPSSFNHRTISPLPTSQETVSSPSPSACAIIASAPSPVLNDEESYRKRRKAEKTLEFARNHPELQMSFSTSTVLELLEEWYVAKDGIPSIEKRDQLYKAQWRGNPSLYKRRRALIKFINDELRANYNLAGATRDDLGILLERYRNQHRQHLSALCTVLQGNGKTEVAMALVSMWRLAKKNRLKA